MAQAGTIEKSGKHRCGRSLSLAALILLGTRFTQGFIFWGGATRRLIYDFHSVDGVDKALKLDFDAPGFVAAKLTHALPGALWVQGPIEWTLRHPDLIVASVWLWTFAELAVGLGLMLGIATRAAAFGSFWLNVVADGDLRLDGIDLPRRMDDGSVRRRHEQRGVPRRRRLLVARRALRRSDRMGAAHSVAQLDLQRAAAGRRAAQARAVARRRVHRVHAAHLSRAVRRGSHAAALTRELPPSRHRADARAARARRRRDVRRLRRCRPRHRCGLHRCREVARRLGERHRRSGTARRSPHCRPGAIRNAYPYAWASKFKPETIGFSGQTGARAVITLPPPSTDHVAPGQTYTLVLEAIDGAKWQAPVIALAR